MFWVVGGSPVIRDIREVSIKLPLKAVRSGISPKLIFASCVGFFYRVYYGFKVTLLQNEKMSAVTSRISSKLIFASYVGYFDRAYYGFYVTSSRMLYCRQYWLARNVNIIPGNCISLRYRTSIVMRSRIRSEATMSHRT